MTTEPSQVAERVPTQEFPEVADRYRRELFNLQDDPIEAQDLSATQPDKVAELSKRLTAWRTEVDAKLPTPNSQFRGKK